MNLRAGVITLKICRQRGERLQMRQTPIRFINFVNTRTRPLFIGRIKNRFVWIQAVVARANRFSRMQVPGAIFGQHASFFVKVKLIDGVSWHGVRHVDESVRCVSLDAVCMRRGFHRLDRFAFHRLIFSDCMHSHLACTVIGGKQKAACFVGRDVASVRVQLNRAQKDELLGGCVNAETGDFPAGTESRVEILAARRKCQRPRRAAHRDVFLKFNRAGASPQRVNRNPIFSSNGEINVSLHVFSFTNFKTVGRGPIPRRVDAANAACGGQPPALQVPELQTFKNPGGPHPPTDTHRHHAVSVVLPMHLVDERHR